MSYTIDDPNMSDTTILITVEHLINQALGASNVNTVDFKLVQAILHILARQQRILQQRVELRLSEQSPKRKSNHEKHPKRPQSPQRIQKQTIKSNEYETTADEKSKMDASDKIEKESNEQILQKDKTAGKERENIEKDKKKCQKENRKNKEEGRLKESSQASLVPSAFKITETLREEEKVLVVERRPTTNAKIDSGTSIDVVTQSQFVLLEEAVKDLRNMAVPAPLALPDNKKLRSDLASGSATLTDAMQAMQVNARVKAAEDTISRMVGLLTQLAASDALPEDLAESLGAVNLKPIQHAEESSVKPVRYVQAEKFNPSLDTPQESVTINVRQSQETASAPVTASTSVVPPSTTPLSAVPLSTTPRLSIGAQNHRSMPSTESLMPGVTRDKLNEILESMRDELMRNLDDETKKASAAAESALLMVQTVSEKLNTAVALNSRISTLYTLVTDYSKHLSGFESGLTTQMQHFQEQIAQIHGDLRIGLEQFKSVNNNTETIAVVELTERYEDLVIELETALHTHASLKSIQMQLGMELQSLAQSLETLREQKCDREEVLDGLRDKVDFSRLTGLLTVAELEELGANLEKRLSFCHDKFHKQDNMWTEALKDLSEATSAKAQLMDLLSLRDEVQSRLRDIDEKLRALAIALGEPEAALLTRKLSVDARCGACRAPALQGAQPPAAGAPPRLPPLHPPPQPAPELCVREWTDAGNRHMCRRWCGGSHTLVTENTTRERAPPPSVKTSTRRYTGYGMDGRLYMMEEERQPCAQCNSFKPDDEASHGTPVPVDLGAGDQGHTSTMECVYESTKVQDA